MAKQIITLAQLTEVQPHRFVTEASDLGLNGWPTTLHVDDTVGNGHPLLRMAPEYTNGELTAVNYRQAWGTVTLRVFND